MNKKKTALIAGAVGLGLLALSRRASASDGRLDPPVGPGGEEPGRIHPPVEPPPPPPPANVSNYVGSGWTWSAALRQTFPNATSIGNALVELGYPVSFANNGDTPATRPFNMISTHNMTIVREFQRDYNDVAQAQQLDTPAVPASLDDDGLVGNNTLRALINAKRWIDTFGATWADVVALS